MHIAKTNSVAEEDFEAVYAQSGLRQELKLSLYLALRGHIGELREILGKENSRGVLRLKEVDWRLSMVTACRQKQKLQCPKFTMQVAFEKQGQAQSVAFDLDYTTMKRLQCELQEAVKSVEGPYARKVQKFIK